MLNEIEGFTDKGGFGSDFRGGCHDGGGTENLACRNGADEVGGTTEGIGGECDGIAVYGRACNILGETTGLISTASKTGLGRAGYKF